MKQKIETKQEKEMTSEKTEIDVVKVECTHDELVKELPSYAGMKCVVINPDSSLPEYITYSPYVCKKCGKRYLVLQAIVQ